MISGKILNKSNRQPMPDVFVKIEGTTIGTATDSDGTFTLASVPGGNHIIKTSLLGYESSVYDLNLTANTNDICIEMNEMAYGIDQVVVTASRTERNLKDVPIAVQIISGKRSEERRVGKEL